MMKINISFPSVMKMVLSTTIDIEESLSLAHLKKQIFDIFWKAMASFSSGGIHGTPEQVTLIDECGVEILNDMELRNRISKSPNFQVIFGGH